MAMPKPAIVTQKVRQACPAMMPLNSQNWVQMRHGLGKMNSETLKAEQMICHSNTTQTSKIHCDHISTCFLSTACPCY